MSVRSQVRDIRIIRKHGIKIPVIAAQEAAKAGLELAVLCAVLEQETGGGRNVYGHDPTIFVGAGQVTEKNYKAYKKARDLHAPANRRMQGVGPMQLTWWAYQDRADKLGGCYLPRFNVRVGCEILATGITSRRRKGMNPQAALRAALIAWNGSAAFGDEVMKRVRKWRKFLYVEPKQGWDSLDESLWQAYTIGRRRSFTDLGTHANKPGSHGFNPAFAFDLGDKLRFKFLGWGWLKARRLVKWYATTEKESPAMLLGLEYLLLGKKMLHRDNDWEPEPFSDPDGSHAFHVHADGIGLRRFMKGGET